jgi:hypothetical protein
MAKLARIAEAGRDVRRRLDQVEVTVTSQRRLFTVTAGHDGRVKELVFADDRYRTLAPAELAAIIVETVQEAASRAGDAVRSTVDEVFPSRFPARREAPPDGDPGLSAEIGATDDEVTYGAMLARLGQLGIPADLIREVRGTLGGDRA